MATAMFRVGNKSGLQVSVHLDQTEPWLLRGDGTVPTQITIEDTDVFCG